MVVWGVLGSLLIWFGIEIVVIPSLDLRTGVKAASHALRQRNGDQMSGFEIRYEELSLTNLIIDSTYQREQNERFQKSVKSMVDNFDPLRLDPPSVAEIDGMFYVWDGQARITALKELGQEKTMCRVAYNIDQRHQAELFHKQDIGKRRVSKIDSHRAGVVALDKDAVEVQEVLDGLGLSYGSRRSTTSGVVSAVGALYWIYDRYDKEVLRLTLQVARDAWGTHRDTYTDRVVKGLSVFINSYSGEITIEEITNMLKDESPTGLLKEAGLQTKANGTNSTQEFAQILRAKFNSFHGRKLRDKIRVRKNSAI